MRHLERIALRPALAHIPHQPPRSLPGAIIVALEVKAWVGPLLLGLDAAHYEARRHQTAVNLHAFSRQNIVGSPPRGILRR